MSIETVALPKRTRESSIVITDDELAEVNAALDDLPEGEAIVVARELDGKPFDTEAKARNYARTFSTEYQDAYGEPTNGNEPVHRLLSTHSVAGELYKSGPNAGKPKSWIAAVSRNTRKPTVKRPDDAPTMRQLTEQVRDWRKANPGDKSFRNYTKLSYDQLRERVNEVTGWNDGNPLPDGEWDADDDADNENNE